MKKVLITATNFSKLCKQAKDLLKKSGVEVIENAKGRPYTYEEIIEVMSEIDGVIAGLDTWSAEVFRHSPKLKGIARFGTGVDNIDLEAAKEAGIKVTNCKGINANAVAEHAVALMLSITRQIPRLNKTTREGLWERISFHQLNKLTVGFIGFGEIARYTAEKITAFGSKMIAYNKFLNYKAADELCVKIYNLEEVLSQSDIITIHIPSLPETKKMINQETIQIMKDGAYLVNTARGDIIDEKALYDALKSGKLAMAAIDVFEVEPVKTDNPLLTLNNIIVTPHSAAEAYDVYEKIGIAASQALVAIFNNEEPENLLN